MSAQDEFNPYSSPVNSDVAAEVTGTRTPGPFAVLFVVIASIIAAGAAFFGTCLGLYAVAANGAGNSLNVGGLFVGCGLFALLVYIFTARFGLAAVRALMSPTQAAPGRIASWLVIFLSACVIAVAFVCCVQFMGFLLASSAAIIAGTVVVWKLPQLRVDLREDPSRLDDATGLSTDIPSFLEDPNRGI